MPSQLPLDPKLPANFDDTPNSERSKEQLDEWWDHPYGITKPDGSFTDRCLNGGARDRSSVLGKVRTYEEAWVLAHDAQAKWVKTRLKPIFMYSNEPPFRLVVQSQRPDYE
ncbi:DNA-binding protein, partial [Klebsiella pneumoniae]|uniref:DNA-binding protein n=2 Tax=Klebsiella/Raoultella group TaxID=2890311 RepID=UPI0009BAC817